MNQDARDPQKQTKIYQIQKEADQCEPGTRPKILNQDVHGRKGWDRFKHSNNTQSSWHNNNFQTRNHKSPRQELLRNIQQQFSVR